MGWKTRKAGSSAQIGQHYQEKERSPYGSHVRRKASGSDVPPNSRPVDEVFSYVVKKPSKTDVIELKDPHSGAPLEPPGAYGNTIVYSPHSGHFSVLNVPEGKPVEPRYAAAHRKSLAMARNYTTQASEKVQKSHSEADIKEAARLFEQAARQEPWHGYPEAGLEKDPVYVQLREADNMISNDIQSARESEGAEKQKWLESARRRVLAADLAVQAAN